MLNGYVGKAVVDGPDGVVADPWHVDRQRLWTDLRPFVPRRKISHELPIGDRDVIPLRRDVVDTGHKKRTSGASIRSPEHIPPCRAVPPPFHRRDAEGSSRYAGKPASRTIPSGNRR